MFFFLLDLLFAQFHCIEGSATWLDDNWWGGSFVLR